MPEARAYPCPVCGAFAQEGDRACRHCATLLATLRCHRCFELSYPDAQHCHRCGSELGLELVEETNPSPHACPDCKVPLRSYAAGAGHLLACESCGGQLVAHALLRELIEQREALGRAAPSRDVPRSNPLLSPVRYRACPECSELMNRKNFGGTSGIVIDVCSLHGSFFDAGELARILEFVRRGGLTRAALPQPSFARASVPTATAFPLAAPPSAKAPPMADAVAELLVFVLDVLS